MALERQRTHQPSVGAPYRGIETLIQYNGILLNDRRFADRYIVKEVTGLDDADVRDSRDENPESDGENAYNSFYAGRTVTLRGEIEAGNISRLREMINNLKRSFNTLEEKRLDFIFNDWYDDFSGDTARVLADYNVHQGTGLTVINGDLAPGDNSFKSFSRQGNTYLNSEVWIRHTTGASLGPYQIGGMNRYIDSNNFIFCTSSENQISLWKKDGGSHISLGATTALSLSTLSTYWTVLRSVDYKLTAEAYLDNNGEVGELIGTLKHTLTGANATKFGAVKGYAGLGWWDVTSDFTRPRISVLDIRSLDNTSDGYIMARKVAKVDIPDTQTDRRTKRPFMITMRASDPTIKGRGTLVDSVDASLSSLTFPAGGAGLTFTSLGLYFTTLTVTTNNIGNYYSYPVVRFYGTVANPTLVNTTTGEKISINTTIASNNYLEVDVFNRTVVDSNGNNRYGYLAEDHEWMRLINGPNILGFGSGSFSGAARAEIYWKYSWV